MEINLFKYLTLKRIWNAVKIGASFGISRVIRKPVVWGMPVTYSVEPTNHCNLECPECPSGLGALTRPLGLLRYEKFKRFIDQVHKTGFYVQLFFQGEPYINKELPKMIRYAQEKNVYVSISTNGLLITEKNVEVIMNDPPDKLIFSLDGLDEKSYQNYRVGGTFAAADKSLRLLINKKQELKSRKPFVELQFIVMKQNEALLDEVVRYGKDTGVDKVEFKSMQVSSLESAEHFLPTIEKYRRYNVTDKGLSIKSRLKDHCFALWRTSVITWDGKVVPCCFDKDAEFVLGTLNGKPFKDIWVSQEYQQFRQGLLNNRRGLDMCSNCTEGLSLRN